MTQTEKPAISRAELVALLAMVSATVAFSIDAMLPALPDIARDLTPEAPNQAQLVVAFFMGGLAFGTLLAGPLSDAWGRRPVAVLGAAIYIVAALVAAMATSIELMFAARIVQGLGAAGARVVAMAITRDLFSGRQMAQVLSFIIIVFSLVPVLAPSLGALIAWGFGWRAIFVSFALFSILTTAWLLLRQPETLPVQKRRPFRVAELRDGMRDIFGEPRVRRSMVAISLVFVVLLSSLMNAQPILDQRFDEGTRFPFWFGLIALIAATGSLINAMVVVRLGMRVVVTAALGVFVALTALYIATLTILPIPEVWTLPAYLIWLTACFYLVGLGMGNLNALAMEPLGHIAGLAASMITAIATLVGVVLAAPIALAFDGTPIPVAFGNLAAGAVALLMMIGMKDGDEA